MKIGFMKIGRLLTGLLLISNICMAEQMYFKEGDVNINVAIKINPSVDFSYLMRANILKKMNKHQEALVDINKYLEKNPKDAYALIERGGIYKAIGNKENAAKDYDEALKL